MRSYDKYISSQRWAVRKTDYYSSHARVCAVDGCDTDDVVHLHHITYERMGEELDDDLVPLCELHHSLVHKLERDQGMDLSAATQLVIRPAPVRRLHRKSPASKAPALGQDPMAPFVYRSYTDRGVKPKKKKKQPNRPLPWNLA